MGSGGEWLSDMGADATKPGMQLGKVVRGFLSGTGWKARKAGRGLCAAGVRSRGTEESLAAVPGPTVRPSRPAPTELAKQPWRNLWFGPSCATESNAPVCPSLLSRYLVQKDIGPRLSIQIESFKALSEWKSTALQRPRLLPQARMKVGTPPGRNSMTAPPLARGTPGKFGQAFLPPLFGRKPSASRDSKFPYLLCGTGIVGFTSLAAWPTPQVRAGRAKTTRTLHFGGILKILELQKYWRKPVFELIGPRSPRQAATMDAHQHREIHKAPKLGQPWNPLKKERRELVKILGALAATLNEATMPGSLSGHAA